VTEDNVVDLRVPDPDPDARSYLRARIEAIEALPEEERARLDELIWRGDTFNNALTDLMDSAPSPDTRRHQEMLALLTAERDAAWAAANDFERERGIREG
jgi:hypothetical protein